jgi:hypothetical protein
LTEREKTVKNGTIFTNIEPLQLPIVRVRTLGKDLRRNGRKKIDVFVGVKTADIFRCGEERTVDLHTTVKSVVNDEIMSHADSVRFHWMTLTVVIIADGWFVEVCYSSFGCVGADGW